MQIGYLELEDGTRLRGNPFGARKNIEGEVVFTTGMVGYPESLTDPSYAGQILVFTYPMIGNYGIPEAKKLLSHCIANFESEKIWVNGCIVSDLVETPSHHDSKYSFATWLSQHQIPGLAGIDTRALTQKLRTHGVMRGKLLTDESLPLQEDNLNFLIRRVSIDSPVVYKPHKQSFKKPILLFDCGVKHGILRKLLSMGFIVERVPWDYKVTRRGEYGGVVISNGPGDPKEAIQTIATIKQFLTMNIPLFGICLGNQILALAAGGETYKLKYGHRSCNQPCIDLDSNGLIMTTQNHGYAVKTKSLPLGWKEWFRNLNDETNEGIRHESKPFFAVQFHPEAHPGPEDGEYLFDVFAKAVKRYEE